MQRALVSVQRVLALDPIEGADRIELATINGWQCVVKKGEFQVGELALYFEIDSVPPDTEPFQFLWCKNDVTRPRPSNFRIKTIRLRGALSQGLLLPLFPICDKFGIVAEGDDLTALLEVTLYELVLPANGTGEQVGRFPGCIPKTDEMRIQSKPKLLEEMKGLNWVATLKLDGTSCTTGYDPGKDEFFVASRNYRIREGDNTYWRAVEHLRDVLMQEKLILQGEIVGPGIQGNKLGVRSCKFVVFNVFDPESAEYFSHADAQAFCEQNGFEMVPVIYEGEDFDLDIPTLLLLAEGKYPHTENEREGLVIRPRDVKVYSPTLQGRLSFKVISNQFLLAQKD